MTIEEIYEYAKNELGVKIKHITKEQNWLVATESGFLIANVMNKKVQAVIELNYGPLGEDMRKQAPFQSPIGFTDKSWAAIVLGDPSYDELIKGELKKLNEWAKQARERQITGNMPKKVSEMITWMRVMYDDKRSAGENFYRQGKWMADFKDSYSKKTAFNDPHPCYQNMTDEQLRYYFTLRKDFRNEKFPVDFNSYVLLFINELFNLIGVDYASDANSLFAAMGENWRHRSEYDRLRNYADAFTAIYERNNGFYFTAKNRELVLSALDPENKVSADVFDEALSAYLEHPLTSSYYVSNKVGYIVLLQRIFKALDERYSFYSHYVADTKVTANPDLNQIYFGYPFKKDKYYMNGQNLIHRDGQWSIEKYVRPKRIKTVQALIDEFDRQLMLFAFPKKKKKSTAPNFIKKVVTEFVKNDWSKLAVPSISSMRLVSNEDLSAAGNFYQQGKYMENFTWESLSFLSIPDQATYEELSDRQLKSYFAWRTKARNGQYIRNENYLHLYINEIINDIGVENSRQGLDKLIELYYAFPGVDILPSLISDYVITHQMTDEYSNLGSTDIFVSRLDPAHLGSDDEILEALRAIVPDFGKNNGFYRKNRKKADQLLVQVYRELVKHPSFFKGRIATYNRFIIKPYGPFIYYERHHKDIEVKLAESVEYNFSVFAQRWFYYGYDESDNEVGLLSGVINKVIDHCYDGKVSPLRYDEEPLYDLVDPIITEYFKTQTKKRKTKITDQKHYDDVKRKVKKAMKIRGRNAYDRFMKQAREMENLELQEMPGLYPGSYYLADYTYLNVDQIMTYIYLRTKWRRGEFSEYNELGLYVRLFAIEVINGIGVKNVQQGYEMIKKIDRWNQHQQLFYDRALDYLPFNYMVAHHLKNEDFPKIAEDDQRIMDLMPHFNKDADTFFTHLQQYLNFNSGYNMCSSPIYKENPELFKKLIYDVLCELEKDPKADLIEKVLAEEVHVRCILFEGLPYEYPEDHYERYELTPIYVFEEGTNGQIYEDYYDGKKALGTYKNVIREIDARARVLMGVKRGLKMKSIDPEIDQALDRLVKQELTKLQKEQEQQAEVKIDFSGLEQIRQDAFVTREKLITEEELADEPEVISAPAEVDDQLSLTKEERDILKLLLAHRDIDDYVSKHHLMMSVIADAINEKLFDEIGDNVIEFAGDQPRVVDDYREDVKKLLG